VPPLIPQIKIQITQIKKVVEDICVIFLEICVIIGWNDFRDSLLTKQRGGEMRTHNVIHNTRYAICLLGLSFILSGCVVRTYRVTRDRVDQDLNIGNRGYLKGEAPAGEAKERKATRSTQIVEVELHSPIKFERMPKAKPQETQPREKTEDEKLWGNRGYITQSETPEITEPTAGMPTTSERYTVQKGDTLQKISQKFYSTTKRWAKIYEANKDTLKGPNKIYPGQVINIPVEGLRETKENLK